MELIDFPANLTIWEKISAVELKGETGTSFIRIYEEGNIRLRMIEYSENYYADHWCSRGHIIFMLEGELIYEQKNGKTFNLLQGNSFLVADNVDEHLVRTKIGARVFIVD